MLWDLDPEANLKGASALYSATVLELTNEVSGNNANVPLKKTKGGTKIGGWFPLVAYRPKTAGIGSSPPATRPMD